MNSTPGRRRLGAFSLCILAAQAQLTTSPLSTTSATATEGPSTTPATITSAPSTTPSGLNDYSYFGINDAAASYLDDQQWRDSSNRAFAVEAELVTYFAEHSLYQSESIVTNVLDELSADMYFISELPTTLQAYGSSFLSVWASYQSVTPNAADSARLHAVAATAVPTTMPQSSSTNAAQINLPQEGALGAAIGLVAGIVGLI